MTIVLVCRIRESRWRTEGLRIPFWIIEARTGVVLFAEGRSEPKSRELRSRRLRRRMFQHREIHRGAVRWAAGFLCGEGPGCAGVFPSVAPNDVRHAGSGWFGLPCPGWRHA